MRQMYLSNKGALKGQTKRKKREKFKYFFTIIRDNSGVNDYSFSLSN
jgi:hypothetical protein